MSINIYCILRQVQCVQRQRWAWIYTAKVRLISYHTCNQLPHLIKANAKVRPLSYRPCRCLPRLIKANAKVRPLSYRTCRCLPRLIKANAKVRPLSYSTCRCLPRVSVAKACQTTGLDLIRAPYVAYWFNMHRPSIPQVRKPHAKHTFLLCFASRSICTAPCIQMLGTYYFRSYLF